ncbi:Zinc finger protein 793, partial [Galemys pyrenaicus]
RLMRSLCCMSDPEDPGAQPGLDLFPGTGYEGTKPYVILRLEQEEAPWICEAASTGCHCRGKCIRQQKACGAPHVLAALRTASAFLTTLRPPQNMLQVNIQRKRQQDMLWRQSISKKTVPKEISHECSKFGKIPFLSTDLFPSIQNPNNWDPCGK